MRQFICGISAALLLASPTLVGPAQAQAQSTAQPGASNPAVPPGKSQDGKSQPVPASPPAANPVPQTAKDDSIANYDVNGSNASDAMGTTP